MVEMCNNHPMFQFLFDDEGKLLAANQRAMQNMQGAALWRVPRAAPHWPAGGESGGGGRSGTAGSSPGGLHATPCAVCHCHHFCAEHLGSCENYTLQSYLSMGECDGSLGPDEMYHEAMAAIFKEDKPCHR